MLPELPYQPSALEPYCRADAVAMASYRKLAEASGVDRILAVATSAIREAGNGEALLRMLDRLLGPDMTPEIRDAWATLPGLMPASTARPTLN